MRTLIFVAILLVAGVFGAKLYVQHKAAGNLDVAIAQLRPYVQLSYATVTPTVSGELRIEKIQGKFSDYEDTFAIDSVTLITPGFGFLLGFDRSVREREVPENLGIDVRGLRTSVGADFLGPFQKAQRIGLRRAQPTAAELCVGIYGFSPDELRELGYDNLVIDVRTAYSRDGNRIKLALAAHTQDMYDVDLAVTFAGISDPTELARGAAPVLVEGRLDYVDRSMNSRITKNCTEHGLSAEEVLAAQQNELQLAARDYGAELDPAILAPYTSFLGGKQRFTLISKPLEPVDLRHVKLYKPSDVPNLLNLMAEVN